MTFEGALIREQGVTFGVIVVRRGVLANNASCDRLRSFGRNAWGPIPIVLMEQDASGRPTYSGRPDIVRFLANRFLEQLPWKRWAIAA